MTTLTASINYQMSLFFFQYFEFSLLMLHVSVPIYIMNIYGMTDGRLLQWEKKSKQTHDIYCNSSKLLPQVVLWLAGTNTGGPSSKSESAFAPLVKSEENLIRTRGRGQRGN